MLSKTHALLEKEKDKCPEAIVHLIADSHITGVPIIGHGLLLQVS